MYIINVYQTFVNTNIITAMQPNNEYYDSLVCETNELFKSLDHDFALALEKSNHLYDLLISSSDALTKAPFHLRDLSNKILEISVKSSSFIEPERLKIGLTVHNEVVQYLLKLTTDLSKTIDATDLSKNLDGTDLSKIMEATEISKLIESGNRVKLFKILMETFNVNKQRKLNSPCPENIPPFPDYPPLEKCILLWLDKIDRKFVELVSVFKNIVTQIIKLEEEKQSKDEDEK